MFNGRRKSINGEIADNFFMWCLPSIIWIILLISVRTLITYGGDPFNFREIIGEALFVEKPFILRVILVPLYWTVGIGIVNFMFVFFFISLPIVVLLALGSSLIMGGWLPLESIPYLIGCIVVWLAIANVYYTYICGYRLVSSGEIPFLHGKDSSLSSREAYVVEGNKVYRDKENVLAGENRIWWNVIHGFVGVVLLLTIGTIWFIVKACKLIKIKKELLAEATEKNQ